MSIDLRRARYSSCGFRWFELSSPTANEQNGNHGMYEVRRYKPPGCLALHTRLRLVFLHPYGRQKKKKKGKRTYIHVAALLYARQLSPPHRRPTAVLSFQHSTAQP